MANIQQPLAQMKEFIPATNPVFAHHKPNNLSVPFSKISLYYYKIKIKISSM